MAKVICNVCKAEDDFEPDEFGLNFFQADGKCDCGGSFCYEDGTTTKEVISFKVRK